MAERLYGRYPFLDMAVVAFKALRLKTVIEIGGIRNPDWRDSDGHATMAWASNAEKAWSVDIDPHATHFTRDMTERFGNVTCVTQDGIEFLKNWTTPFDLLYLDAWDVGTPDYQQNHLAAYMAVAPLIQHLILIDDCHKDGSGKGELVVAQAKKDGFVPLFE